MWLVIMIEICKLLANTALITGAISETLPSLFHPFSLHEKQVLNMWSSINYITMKHNIAN